MENNFFVGEVYHSASTFTRAIVTKDVLLELSPNLFVSLDDKKTYHIGTLNETKGDFVINGTLILTDPQEHSKNYNYLAQSFLGNK